MKQNSAMLTSFDFDTSPCINGPSYNHISATPTDKSGTTHDVITFNQPPFSFTESGFDVCQYTYSFTAVPDDGESINTEQNPTDFTGLEYSLYHVGQIQCCSISLVMSMARVGVLSGFHLGFFP